MADANFVQMFAQVGVKVDAVEVGKKGELEVALTIGQYSGKLMEVLPNARLITIRGNRVVAGVDPAELTTAVENRVKAPRASAGNVTITTRTVYSVEAPDAVNNVTGGWWDSDEGYGVIEIAGHEFSVGVGRAADFYEVDDEGNPDRPVFHVTLTVQDEKGEEQVQLTSYSFMNLLKRVCAVRATIIG